MKFINRNGRVLLEVTAAHWQGAPHVSAVLYTYKGDGCGGVTDNVGIQKQFELHKEWAPSVRIEGTLPEPRS